MRRGATAPFAAAIFAGAWQVFLVQPVAAKMLLPRLGGSPSVWIACMLFFQAVLLGGYTYAHALARLAPRAQAAIHLAIALVAAAVLPLAIPGGWTAPAEGASPLGWTFAALAVALGPPMLALSATGPLLQRWFASCGVEASADPYFLYAASNLGSLGALVAYPFLVEPRLTLSAQRAAWSWGYGAWIVMTAACAILFLRSGATAPPPAKSAARADGRTRARWILLAFLPSSLVLGVTQYLTTDIAAVPLLWVLPLALYLLSFVVAFARRQVVPAAAWSLALAVLATAAAAAFWAFSRPYVWLLLALHPLVVFAAGMVCHGRLASERPEPSNLTEFYLAIAAGGVLGGVFNALVAPLVFPAVVEYPVVLVAACLLRPGARARKASGWLGDLVWAAALFATTWLMRPAVEALAIENEVARILLMAVVPCALGLVMAGRPRRFAAGLAVLLAVGWWQTATPGTVVHRARTFFGVHRVIDRPGPPFTTTDPSGREVQFRVPFRVLYHGTTRHGIQALDERWRRTPTSYYHRTGPIGQVFAALGGGLRDVAVVGLGAGTLAAYGDPARRFTFYELDPEVVSMARDPRWFTFVADSASKVSFVTGDGRMRLAEAPDASYDLVVVDAFSSDAIPLHLLTREALAIYLAKLRPGGLVALHLTNQNFDLVPVVGALAGDARLAALVEDDDVTEPEQLLEAKDGSTWAVVARDAATLAPLEASGRWRHVPSAATRLWTDDYSNVVGALRGN